MRGKPKFLKKVADGDGLSRKKLKGT